MPQRILPETRCLSPFIKWPGGKRWLFPEFTQYLPTNFNTYHEPFLGSGSMFFAITPKTANLSDVNAELINLFRQVRDRPRSLMGSLASARVSHAFYKKKRREQPTRDLQRAARLLYLIKTSFNGIYRVNRQGHFNVPFGWRTNTTLIDRSAIQLASEALNNVRLRCIDFEKALRDARSGDLVYCDPPYTVCHDSNGFLRYNEALFSWHDQKRLAGIAETLVASGVYVLVSNAHHPAVRRLYKAFRAVTVSRRSAIAADPTSRGIAREYLLIGAPKVKRRS